MKIVFPLAAAVLLFAVGYLGGSVAPFVFGVIVPYAAIAVFIAGVCWKVAGWARSPVPFKITTTAGQQKSLPWIRHDRLDAPQSTLQVVARMALEVLLFRSLFKNTKSELKSDRNLAYSQEIWLWAAGLVFHWSFLIIFLRHFRFFTEPAPLFVDLLQNVDGFFEIAVPTLYLSDVAVLAAVSYLFFRRVYYPQMRYISLPSDYFPLFLILGIAASGVLMRHFFKVDLVGVKTLAAGLFAFNLPETMPEIGAIFYGHLFLVSSLLIYFPFSKLTHMAGIFMSPTRNMANDNRAGRHTNPWNPEVEVHTYQEWEDEFRDLMKAADIPVEKD